ncbi:hypothetical protein Pmani_003047 [Petrolisthes manimaculis]|uniref:Sulfotransferase domain-containing protein n=1 Tax=Petrolisthes manimaculis TaxID=1843537 RepID=A0AAE1QGP0_9EUCA|nr:hypothetical protein Pmani_003047 [Petrolisthes manimaculis]
MVMVMIVGLILNMDRFPLYNLYSLTQTARERPPENFLPMTTPKHLPPPSSLPLSKIYPGRLPNIENGKLPLERSSKMWAIWEKDDHGSPCREYLVRFSKGLPKVQLMSFPGSGNSWTRYLLEASTGIFTGSVFNDSRIFKTGMLGEEAKPDDGRTLVQKIHGIFLKYSNLPSVPAVLLIRNPAKAIISWFKLRVTHSHVDQISYQHFNTSIFHQLVPTYLEEWEMVAMDNLLEKKAPVHLVYYERLKEDPISTLRGILAFLGVPVDESRLNCTRTHLKGPYKREGNREFNPYTTEEQLWMAQAVKRVNQTVQLLGYQPLPHYSIVS